MLLLLNRIWVTFNFVIEIKRNFRLNTICLRLLINLKIHVLLQEIFGLPFTDYSPEIIVL
ncbi:MAG: hypothetical protein EDM69_07605 [Chlorobiota bacterium]|nr:MAG: hypothetical protein EDM69_07605 [Chlorobiota bacterium]MCE7953186.1 hypothetical protein [Chlorobi bacterium CHB7]RIK50057.1 MAG: hypothetical protein DCC60_01420 [Ignavibacteriota bacterium]